MRTFLILLAAIILTGCAARPGEPATTTTPTPTTSMPVYPEPPVPGAAWTATSGTWRYSVSPSVISGDVGDAVDLVIAAESSEGERSGTLTIDSAWIVPSRPTVQIEGGRGRLATQIYLGATETFRASLFDATDDRHHVFEGPPLRASGLVRSVPFERFTTVSDDPPGLSVEVDGSTVRVTYAAKANATTSGEEAVSAKELMLVRTQNETRLVAFATRSHNDAIQFFPEPQRTRVVAEVADVPVGEVRVLVISERSCFCGEFPPPVVDEVRVVVR